MPTRKKKAPGKPGPRASGPTQPESKRKNPQLLLRLPPRTIELLRKLSATHDVSISGLVDACVHAAHNSGTLTAMLAIARLAAEKGATG